MSTVSERPEGANATDPPESEESPPSPPWKPSNPGRWAHMALEDPDPSGALPPRAMVADVLAWALVPPGAVDPIEGIVDGVRVELAAFADALGARPVSEGLRMLCRRLEAALKLLRWIDNRERMPFERHFEEPPPAVLTPEEPPAAPPPSEEPAEVEEDVEVTRDAAPSGADE